MKEKKGFVTTKKERFAYCLFFLGQNILWGFAGYVETFLTVFYYCNLVNDVK